jgi:hypothetical protein
MVVSGYLRAPAFYPREKSPRYQLFRGLGGPQGRSGRCREWTNPLPLPGIESLTSIPQPVAIPAELSRLIICHRNEAKLYR